MQIAIDGPAGAGKSTAARRVARRLGITHIDTGAMYRAVGLYARWRGADTADEAAIAAILPEIDINPVFADGEQRLLLNGKDVTAALRTPMAGMDASAVARHKKVRDFLVAGQRRLASGRDVVMDGRDIGSVVLPGADVKVYLNAGINRLFERRVFELKEKGIAFDQKALRRDVEARVLNDRTRELSPDKPCEGAIIIDTELLDEDMVEEAIVKLLD